MILNTNNDEYSFINGKKYKKCKENQIRNPITNRCNKIKPIYEYSLIDGKKYKKCKMGKIRNPLTKKCNKIKNNDLKLSKIKKLIIPFINRVSINIEDRIRYYFLIKRKLDLKKYNNKACISIYKIIDNKPIYRIGNNIIIKNRIGKDSANGIVFLSSFRNKYNRLFKYTCKITLLTKNSEKDKIIQKILLKALARCPHFPIVYGFLTCKKNYKYIDSYIKSNTNSISVSQDLKYYPKLIKDNPKKNFLISFNELANGDLEKFITDINVKYDEVFNSLVQIFISIIFYYKETGLFHLDTNWGNFLYHKIKPGGYLHYRFFNKDYYLKNIGYLWIIWDFELSYPIDNNLKKYKHIYYNDFSRILRAYVSKYHETIDYGWNKNPAIINNKLIVNTITDIYNDIFLELSNNSNNSFQINDLILLIKNIIKTFEKKNLLLETLPDNSIIINKTPYEFNGKIVKFSEVLNQI